MAIRHVCIIDTMDLLGGAQMWAAGIAADLPGRGWRTSLVARPGSPLAALADERGLACDEIPIRFDAAPWTILRLLAVLRRRKARAVLCLNLKDLKAAGVAARLAGVPVILLSRESDSPLRRRFYYRWYLGGVATGVVVNSRATASTTLRSARWLDPRRVHLLYKGIDAERFRPGPRADGNRDGGAPVVGFVGRTTESKGVPELMRAWEMIAARDDLRSPRLRLAGRGPLDAEIARWREGLPRPGNVEILGFAEDMPGFYRGIDILAAPSRVEGFGLAVAEAGACAVPVVAARASSLPEIVRHRETGLLTPPRDPRALADALAALILDPGLAARLGAAARRRVASAFPRDAMLDNLARLLETGNVPETGAGKETP